MTNTTLAKSHQVAIGGVGGSGTRLGAALLRELGYFVGSDLNDALDNLWFTMLFKRRSVLVDSRKDFGELANIFWSRMSGGPALTDKQRTLIEGICDEDRLQHDRAWLVERANSFMQVENGSSVGRPWGWKEPNTHIVIERLFDLQPLLRYIHIVRHPLDVAFSPNQSQVQNWGPIFLSRDVSMKPRDSLAYWCAADRRVRRFLQDHPDRTLLIDFDTLCSDPMAEMKQVAVFLNTVTTESSLEAFARSIDASRPKRRRLEPIDLAEFRIDDVEYVRSLRYEIGAAKR